MVLSASLAGVACSLGDSTAPVTDMSIPRLTMRPALPTRELVPGLYKLWDQSPTAFLLVPESYIASTAAPLIVALHGAGITADGPRNLLGPYAEANGFLLLIPESTDYTWDGIHGLYGPDLAVIDSALTIAFDHCAVDTTRVCLEGFSDGASYALGVGITNPEVFSHVIGFSPGFVTNAEVQPRKPRVFISHGLRDPILPIELASRVIVPELTAAGYDVTYNEYDGVHAVTPEVAQAAVQFLLSG